MRQLIKKWPVSSFLAFTLLVGGMVTFLTLTQESTGIPKDLLYILTPILLTLGMTFLTGGMMALIKLDKQRYIFSHLVPFLPFVILSFVLISNLNKIDEMKRLDALENALAFVDSIQYDFQH